MRSAADVPKAPAASAALSASIRMKGATPAAIPFSDVSVQEDHGEPDAPDGVDGENPRRAGEEFGAPGSRPRARSATHPAAKAPATKPTRYPAVGVAHTAGPSMRASSGSPAVMRGQVGQLAQRAVARAENQARQQDGQHLQRDRHGREGQVDGHPGRKGGEGGKGAEGRQCE